MALSSFPSLWDFLEETQGRNRLCPVCAVSSGVALTTSPFPTLRLGTLTECPSLLKLLLRSAQWDGPVHMTSRVEPQRQAWIKRRGYMRASCCSLYRKMTQRIVIGSFIFFISCVFMHVLCVNACVCTYTCVCVSVKARRWYQASSLVILCFIYH